MEIPPENPHASISHKNGLCRRSIFACGIVLVNAFNAYTGENKAFTRMFVPSSASG